MRAHVLVLAIAFQSAVLSCAGAQSRQRSSPSTLPFT